MQIAVPKTNFFNYSVVWESFFRGTEFSAAIPAPEVETKTGPKTTATNQQKREHKPKRKTRRQRTNKKTAQHSICKMEPGIKAPSFARYLREKTEAKMTRNFATLARHSGESLDYLIGYGP